MSKNLAQFSKVCSILLLSFFMTNCMQTVNENHSQWRGETENHNRLAQMYALTIPICDGKPIDEHTACVSSIRKEFAQRFADRFSAYYTASSAETLLATAIVLSYAVDAQNSSTTTNPASSSANTSRICRTHQFSKQFSVSLSSFTAIPVTCS